MVPLPAPLSPSRRPGLTFGLHGARPDAASAPPRARTVRRHLAHRGPPRPGVLRREPAGVPLRSRAPALGMDAPRPRTRLHGLGRRRHPALGRGPASASRRAAPRHGARGRDERVGGLSHAVPDRCGSHADVGDAACGRAAPEAMTSTFMTFVATVIFFALAGP